MFDTSHSMFRPLWVRILLTVVVCGWGLFELSMNNTVWAILFLALGAWCVWELLITYKPGDDGKENR
ncbi:DUF3329 domain-containing protein [Jiella marina]|uniref:DUF3329 domain-containing protein n=1 Tax=Jiella sp. LLJ827 TaxID=2917712 RepID=UPI00210160A1|nr:DUF3329 domain-containing protein [Jiella sp. LLJ827]MCQ0987264.1 DUF3329 domain-containing protein [Jiella sp. LLJ827]